MGWCARARAGRGPVYEAVEGGVPGAGLGHADHVPEVPSGARGPVRVQPALPHGEAGHHRRVAVSGPRPPPRPRLPARGLHPRYSHSTVTVQSQKTRSAIAVQSQNSCGAVAVQSSAVAVQLQCSRRTVAVQS
eukprot:5600863-Pyramimonas_sp.AAC.1